MFTGLIEQKGVLVGQRSRGNYLVLTVETSKPFESTLVKGESVACDGACLTVVSFDQRKFTVEASQETAARTIIGKYRVGQEINLERAMKLGERLGGHLVSGHVDEVGRIDYLKKIGESIELTLLFDKKYDRLVIDKGSISVNGVSLTLNEVRSGWLSVNLIPHTARETTLGGLGTGDGVNLEFDMIGKYVARMFSKETGGLTKDKLKEFGW